MAVTYFNLPTETQANKQRKGIVGQPSKCQSNYSIHPLVFLLFVRWHRLSVRNCGHSFLSITRGARALSGLRFRSATTLKVRASASDNDRLRCKRKPGNSRNEPGNGISRRYSAVDAASGGLRGV